MLSISTISCCLSFSTLHTPTRPKNVCRIPIFQNINTVRRWEQKKKNKRCDHTSWIWIFMQWLARDCMTERKTDLARCLLLCSSWSLSSLSASWWRLRRLASEVSCCTDISSKSFFIFCTSCSRRRLISDYVQRTSLDISCQTRITDSWRVSVLAVRLLIAVTVNHARRLRNINEW